MRRAFSLAFLAVAVLNSIVVAAAVSPRACERIFVNADKNLFQYENRVRRLISQLKISPTILDTQQILETQGLWQALDQMLNVVRSASTGLAESEASERVSDLENRARKLMLDVGGLLTQLAGSGAGEGALAPWTAALREALIDLHPLQETTLHEMARGLLEAGTAADDIAGLAQTYRSLSVHSWLGEAVLARLAVHFWQNRRPAAVNDGFALIDIAQQLAGRKRSFESFITDYLIHRLKSELSFREATILALEIAKEGGTPREEDVLDFFATYKQLKDSLPNNNLDIHVLGGLTGAAWRAGWRKLNIDEVVELVRRIGQVFKDLELRRHVQLAQSILQGSGPMELEDLQSLRQSVREFLDSSSALHTLFKGVARGHSGEEIREVFLLGRRLGQQLKSILRTGHQEVADLAGVRLAELFFKVPHTPESEAELLAYFSSIYVEINQIDDSALQAAHMSKSVWSAVNRGVFFPHLSTYERARRVSEIYSQVSRFRRISGDGALRIAQAIIRAGGTSEVVDEARRLHEVVYAQWSSEDGVRAVLNALRTWERRRQSESSFEGMDSP